MQQSGLKILVKFKSISQPTTQRPPEAKPTSESNLPIIYPCIYKKPNVPQQRKNN